MNRQLLKIPAVLARYPNLDEPVVDVQIRKGFAFAEAATEVLASTLVAMREVQVERGVSVRTDWPSKQDNACSRAPPSLNLTSLESTVGNGSSLDCKIYIGFTQGALAEELQAALTSMFWELSAFRSKYSGITPVLDVRRGNGPFAFADLADAVLASTAVSLGSMRLRDGKATLCRPLGYTPQVAGHTLIKSTGGDSSILLPCVDSPATVPLPLPPPPPPAQLPAQKSNKTLFIANIPFDTMEPDLLDDHLTHMALETPGFDLERGPPVTRIHMNAGRGFAFADLRDESLASLLIPKLNGALFLGRELKVHLARHGGWQSNRPLRCDDNDMTMVADDFESHKDV